MAKDSNQNRLPGVSIAALALTQALQPLQTFAGQLSATYTGIATTPWDQSVSSITELADLM